MSIRRRRFKSIGLRWLDSIFLGLIPPKLEYYLLVIKENTEKPLPQLHQTKMKICYE